MIRERRFAGVIRMEIEESAHPEVRELLIEQLDLDEAEVFDLPAPLDYRDFMSLFDLDRPDLKRDPWEPRDHPRLPRSADVDIFEEIRRKDMLVHHPYHSFEGTVQRFFDEAAHDPDVLAIKAAIYRTAEDSAVVESLIEAARNGKQVGVMVELKARFDEENNLRWVERLEEEGIHVAYGKLGYKAHTKTALVVREEADGVNLYSHVGTGNYHSETAKQYEDLGLLTADRAVGQDLVKLFNYFTGHSLPDDYETLLFAPTNMRERFVERIRREAEHASEGKPARIVAKVNRLEDAELARELYEAAQAGVEIDLIVRDICRLRPGLAGVSETISVRSIVGRFLEHSRVWQFHNDGEPEYFIGSADWMHRNLDDRVEAVVPIEDPDLQSYLEELLEMLLVDNRRAWELQPDGSYLQLTPGDEPTIDTHDRLMQRATEAEPERESDPVAVDLEAPLAPDTEEVEETIHLPDSFVEPALDEVIRSLDVDSDHGTSAWRASNGDEAAAVDEEEPSAEVSADASSADSTDSTGAAAGCDGLDAGDRDGPDEAVAGDDTDAAADGDPT
jgi:polyphosphate kinase